MVSRAPMFVVGFAVSLAFAFARPLASQSVRISGSTSVRYLELRPFVRDSVPESETQGSALLRQLPDGRVVRCIPDEEFCRDTRPGARTSSVPQIHDVEVSAWGFAEGLHLYTQLRGRATSGESAELWPRSDDPFDVLAAYAELERNRFRVRGGRQWKVSGLGFYNFDGVAVTVAPTATASLEVYGGRSLVRGLNEPRTQGALESVEPLAALDAGVIGGAHARYRPASRVAVSALYQLDIRGDRRGVYSELGALDGMLLLGSGSIDAAMEADLASGALTEARIRALSAPFGRMSFHAELRRYRPYFELWTIWGAFSPVGFDEARGGVTWSDPAGRLILRSEGTRRRYADAGTDDGAAELRDDGWGLGSRVSWLPTRQWRLETSYRVETGFGAARSDGHVGVTRRFGESASVSAQGIFFERLYEFRLDEGKVLGVGVEALVPVSDGLRFMATAATYRHQGGGTASGLDWNQRRASVRVEWTMGAEPGRRRVGTGGGA